MLTYSPQGRYAMTDANALTCYNRDDSDRLSPVSEFAGSIFYSHDSADNLKLDFEGAVLNRVFRACGPK